MTNNARTPETFWNLFNDFTCAAVCVERFMWLQQYHWMALDFGEAHPVNETLNRLR